MRNWQSMLVVVAAVIAGFGLGHHWSAVTESSGKGHRQSISAQPKLTAIADNTGRHLGEPSAGTASQVAADVDAASAAVPGDVGEQLPAEQSRSEVVVVKAAEPTSYERQQAFDEASLLVSEQINSGQWYPEQQAAIHAAAQLLTIEQREQLLSAFVGAMNRGELDHAMPIPPI